MTDFLEPKEIHAIIDSVKNISKYPVRDVLLFKLLWQSGARVSEAIALLPEHIGKTSIVIHNLKQVKRVKKRIKNPETSKIEVTTTRFHDANAMKEVQISEQLCSELKQFCKDNNIHDGGWVFQGNWRKQEHLSRFYVNRILDKASIDAGIIRFGKRNKATGGRYKGAWPHLFRHSTAMILMDKTSNIRLVQQHLGHASIQTTTIYAQATKGKLREAIDKIDW